MNIQQAFQSVKSKVTVRQVLDFHSVAIRNNQFKCTHYDHEDRKPSASIRHSDQAYFCYSCGKGGDVGKLYERGINGSTMTPFEALNQIVLDFNLDLDLKSFGANEADDYLTRIYSIINKKGNKTIGDDYLKKRGMSNHIGMGYLPYNLDFKKEGDESGYHLIKGRLCLPIRNPSGVIIGFAGRDLSNKSKHKYMNTRYEKSSILHNLWRARKAARDMGFICIVEGYTDTNAAIECNLHNFVDYSSATITEGQAKLIADERIYCAILFTDGDEASMNALRKNITNLCQAGLFVKVIVLEDKDPAEWLTSLPKTATIFDKAVGFWDFFDFKPAFKLAKMINGRFRPMALKGVASKLDIDIQELINISKD